MVSSGRSRLVIIYKPVHSMVKAYSHRAEAKAKAKISCDVCHFFFDVFSLSPPLLLGVSTPLRLMK